MIYAPRDQFYSAWAATGFIDFSYFLLILWVYIHGALGQPAAAPVCEAFGCLTGGVLGEGRFGTLSHSRNRGSS